MCYNIFIYYKLYKLQYIYNLVVVIVVVLDCNKIALVSSAPPQGDTLYSCNVLAKRFVRSLAHNVHILKRHK